MSLLKIRVEAVSHFHTDGGQCFPVCRALDFIAAFDADGLRGYGQVTSYCREETPPPARQGNLFLGVMFENNTLKVF